MLRMSTLFLRTLREDPADAEVPSHRLLVRAGYVRRIAPGVFSWLPLGYLVYRNVEAIVRAEMDAAGFQEVHFPALLPREPYEATDRWMEYGDTLFRLQDRKGNDLLLGPTHEEMFTLMVKGEYSSYRDLPLRIYQIQTKYRDEARPRAGILRGREFVMKDSYSFDVDEAGLQASYDAHRVAYRRTFEIIAEPASGVVLIHCTAGKDRTGWASAVLQLWLGMDEADVRADYLRSNEQQPEMIGELVAAFVAAGGDPAAVANLVTVRGDYLDLALERVAESHGTVDQYFRRGLGLSDETLSRLQDRLVLG